MSCCIKNARPDLARCQGRKRNGNLADGNSAWERCATPPEWLATEADLSQDGHMSSMALCAGCRQLIETQSPGQYLFKRILKSRCRPTADAT